MGPGSDNRKLNQGERKILQKHKVTNDRETAQMRGH
jgi:hypothetical protein